MIEVKVPSPGESITQVQLASWLVKDGAYVEKDDEVAEIDSDKATLSISAEESGKIELIAGEGDTLEVGAVVAKIDTEAEAPKKEEKAPEKNAPAQPQEKEEEATVTEKSKNTAKSEEPGQTKPKEDSKQEPTEKDTQTEDHSSGLHVQITPLAQQILQEKGIDENELKDSIKSMRISRSELESAIEHTGSAAQQPKPAQTSLWSGERETKREKMSTLRQKITERLVSVKNETAMLTTFNEVNMEPVMQLRKKYKEEFVEKYGLKPGLMSFFTMASAQALQHFPYINAQLDGEEIIYHQYADIGIAVSAPKGLMVPVLRDAQDMSLAEIEEQIKEKAGKARKGKLSLDEMSGGTFTITNGGVFGSMLSTPIINPPQSAILGMHNIQERPVAVDGKVEIKPMMYIALSYDHRIVDGKDSVSFLVKIKELLENPVNMLFNGTDPEKALMGL